MKYCSWINCFLVVLALMISCVPSEAIAQDVMKSDPPKAGQRFSSWCKKQQDNYEKTMNSIKESQFATFIGDGIKAAKQGIAYVQQGMKYVQDKIKEIKESNAYKTAMISKQIAEKGMELKNMQEELKSNLKALEEEAKVGRSTIEAKIAQSKENFEITSASYQEELTRGDTGQGSGVDNQKIAEFQQNVELDLSQFNQEIEMIEQNLKQRKKELEYSFAEDIYNLGEEIADLTMQLEELYADDEAKDNAETDPNNIIQGAISSFGSKVAGEATSLQEKARQRKRKNREKKKALTRSEDIVGPTTEQADEKQDQDETTSAASSTMNGDSEAIQFAIKSTMGQIEGLESYLLAELSAIENETMELLSNEEAQGDYEINKDSVKAYIDVCAYTGEKGGLAGLKDKIGNTVNKVTNGINKVTSTVSDVQNKIGEVTAAGQQLQEAGSSIAGSLGGSVDLKSMGL